MTGSGSSVGTCVAETIIGLALSKEDCTSVDKFFTVTVSLTGLLPVLCRFFCKLVAF